MMVFTAARRILALSFLLIIAGCGGSSGGGGTQPPVTCANPVQIQANDSVSGSLSAGDCSPAVLFPGQTNDQSLLDQYSVTLPVAGELTILMRSTQFDAYLVLLDSQLTLPPIAEDDDSGGNFDAQIVVSLAAGTYRILANSATFNAVTGSYTLTTSFLPVVWSPTSTVGAPEPRAKHSAVWTDAEMIVWGGDDGNSITKDSGGRYDPATDSWTATSQAGAPSPRSSQTAVWTGSEMIVWGGFTGAFDFDTIGDGARYDPSTDSWATMSAVDQPSPRTGHTAVWTGSEMIVWGGASCVACANAELGTGARYNPATDTWTPMSTLNAPEARFNHTAVWTGSEMIVWGGESDQGIALLTPLDSGGIYDPVTDSWTPMTTVGAPLPARCHAAVWTGTEMIVFGGQTDVGLACELSSVNTGKRYDPGTDTWTSMADAPIGASYGPSAVWTGDRMIGWLGEAFGRYDPVSNTWQGVSTVSAPTGRPYLTVIWTGTRMIVWGGEFAGPLGTGSIYDPRYDDTP